MTTAEQQARDILERLGVDDAQSFTSDDLVEIANIIAERDRLHLALAGPGGACDTIDILTAGPKNEGVDEIARGQVKRWRAICVVPARAAWCECVGVSAYECAACRERRCMECDKPSGSLDVKTAVRWCPTHREDGNAGRLGTVKPPRDA